MNLIKKKVRLKQIENIQYLIEIDLEQFAQ